MTETSFESEHSGSEGGTVPLAEFKCWHVYWDRVQLSLMIH